MADFDIRELYRPDGIVPVNTATTGYLAREIMRLRKVLSQIADGTPDSDPPFRAMDRDQMRSLARAALVVSNGQLGGEG